MTKVCPEIQERILPEPVLTVSADVSFASNHFPTYKLGPENQIVEEPKEDEKGPSVKDTVEKESELLSDQHKRLSVRDLASKFDKNLAAAVSLADEAKLREVASLEGHVMLKKLRDALEYMRGRTDGQNKEDVEKAISMVEALAVKLTQNEGELIQEKFEVKKLGNFLKQASEDAKKLVNQEKSFACAEIESARAVVLKLGEAFEEQERSSEASRAQGPDVEKLVEEVQEARQIKRMHHPTKVVISQMNGQDYASRSHVFTIGNTRIKLSRGWITKAREIYSTSMQLCGVRGNIKAPSKALFWQPRKSLTFILTFESEQERNTAITLARKYAFDCNVTLLGPDD